MPLATTITLQAALAISAQRFSGTILRGPTTLAGAEGSYSIERLASGEANPRRPRPRVWIDQYSGAILQVESPRELSAGAIFLNYLWPLHSGRIIGLLGRVLICRMGFAPLIVFSAGLSHWRRRGVRQRLASSPRQAR